jgi:hypothetical protein
MAPTEVGRTYRISSAGQWYKIHVDFTAAPTTSASRGEDRDDPQAHAQETRDHQIPTATVEFNDPLGSRRNWR